MSTTSKRSPAANKFMCRETLVMKLSWSDFHDIVKNYCFILQSYLTYYMFLSEKWLSTAICAFPASCFFYFEEIFFMSIYLFQRVHYFLNIVIKYQFLYSQNKIIHTMFQFFSVEPCQQLWIFAKRKRKLQ